MSVTNIYLPEVPPCLATHNYTNGSTLLSCVFPRSVSRRLWVWRCGVSAWSIARSCSLTAVADVLAPLMGQSYNTLRERLRDTYREADAKAGKQRVELDVTECWAPWLAWLLDGWSSQQIAIAMDATSLGDRFVVLAISVVYRGCAVPVAWKVLKAEEKHAWKPEWQALLKRFKGLVPIQTGIAFALCCISQNFDNSVIE